MAALTDLISQRTALDQQIAQLQAAERASAISEIRALMTTYDLTVADLTDGAKPRGKSAGLPSTVKAKYRHPATGESWTGRGMKPRWLKSALAADSSKTLTDFLIEQ